MASALLAADLGADALLIVTDVDAVYENWGTPDQRAIRSATPDMLAGRLRRRLDGPQGAGRVLVRRTHRQLRRDRLDRPHPVPCSPARPAPE